MRGENPISLKLPEAYVLSANYAGKSKVNVVLPGGESFAVSIPDWEIINRLPREMPLIQKIAAAFGFVNESKDEKILAYDFESISKGISPNPDRDTLLSCAFWGDGYASVYKSDNPIDVLTFFIDTINERDPDIIAGYFANRYDMLMALVTGKRFGIPVSIGRDGSEPVVIYRKFDNAASAGDRFKVRRIDIDGRLHFDVFDEVLYDQSLNGIKGVGLKAVAKFLKIKHVVEVDRRAVNLLNTVDLLDYNLSDARLTYILAKTYMMNLKQLAEDMRLPMNLITTRTPSHIPNYIYGRDFLKRGIPYSGDNQTRFPSIFGSRSRKCYQGGYVDIFQTGIFRPVDKIDFVNMYPAIMAMGNFDPYSVTLVDISEFTDQAPRFDGDKITVSDSIIGDVTCRIDLSQDSATRVFLSRFIKTKAALKPRSRTDPLAKSQYWVVKLVMNAASGYHGLRYAKWGSVLVIILTTAIGRWFLKSVCAMEPTRIEADTDGVYANSRLSQARIQAYEKAICDLVPDDYMKKFIKLDVDHYKAGLFTNEKNYVLLKENGDLLFHGASLKGKHLPAVCDRALQRLISVLFADGNWRSILDDIVMMPEDLKDFVMKASFNKVNYEGNSLYAQLEKQLANHGIQIFVGDTAKYVKTVTGYSVVELAGREDIDENYYLKRIADIITRALEPIESLKSKDLLKIMKSRGDS